MATTFGPIARASEMDRVGLNIFHPPKAALKMGCKVDVTVSPAALTLRDHPAGLPWHKRRGCRRLPTIEIPSLEFPFTGMVEDNWRVTGATLFQPQRPPHDGLQVAAHSAKTRYTLAQPPRWTKRIDLLGGSPGYRASFLRDQQTRTRSGSQRATHTSTHAQHLSALSKAFAYRLLIVICGSMLPAGFRRSIMPFHTTDHRIGAGVLDVQAYCMVAIGIAQTRLAINGPDGTE